MAITKARANSLGTRVQKQFWQPPPEFKMVVCSEWQKKGKDLVIINWYTYF